MSDETFKPLAGENFERARDLYNDCVAIDNLLLQLAEATMEYEGLSHFVTLGGFTTVEPDEYYELTGAPRTYVPPEYTIAKHIMFPLPDERSLLFLSTALSDLYMASLNLKIAELKHSYNVVYKPKAFVTYKPSGFKSFTPEPGVRYSTPYFPAGSAGASTPKGQEHGSGN